MDGQMGVETRHHALASRFFVTRGAVDLSGKKEVFHQTGLQRHFQLGRRKIVVLNRIPRTEHFDVFKTRNQAQRLVLYILRQGRRKAVDVNFAGIPTFGLHKKLVPIFVGKAVDFVFNRRAIPWPQTLDAPVEHR